MTPRTSVPLIVADGDIATTRLVARELGVVYDRVEVRVPENLFGTEFALRPIVVSRLCHPSLAWLPEYLAQRGLRYAYLLDDNFWELTPDVDPHLADFFNHPAAIATLDHFVRSAAVVIVWSERLQHYVSARFPAARVEFVPTGVDLAALTAASPAAEVAPDGVIRIGYPTSRRPGVASLLTQVVRGLADKYGDRIRFEFIGWMPESLEGLPLVSLTPQIVEYDRYVEFVLSRRWDIGLAPLAGGRFESFKTDVKYREYASFRVPGVYSRVSPYTDSVMDGRTGILADTDPDTWGAALARMIETPRLRSDIAEAALADIQSHRDLRDTGRRFAALLPAPADAAVPA